jgi:hypothetical protein
MSDVQAERLRAERELSDVRPPGNATAKQVRDVVLALNNISGVLGAADLKLKSQLYEELGITVEYNAHDRIATACAKVCVGGPDYAKPDWRIQPWTRHLL